MGSTVPNIPLLEWSSRQEAHRAGGTSRVMDETMVGGLGEASL